MLAILISPEYRAVCSFYVYDNQKKINALLDLVGDEHAEQLELIQKTEIQSVLILLSQAWEQLDSAVCKEPVKFLGRKEIKWLADQHEKTRFFNSKRLILSIDPYDEPESILETIKQTLVEMQEENRNAHEDDWSVEEREIWTDEYINAINPEKDFIYKATANKGRGLGSFVDESFHALLLYELKKHLKKKDTEILKRFFNTNESNYAAKNQEKNRLKNKANRLIYNALSGRSMQS